MDFELLDTAIKIIETEPERHRQDVWVIRSGWCGTKACLAGHIAMLAGWKPKFHCQEAANVATKDGRMLQIPDAALDALGIGRNGPHMWERSRVEAMFWSTQTLDDIKRMRDQFEHDYRLEHHYSEKANEAA